MTISTTSFSPNTLIKSADINTNFSTITAAIPWSSNPVAAKGDILVGTAANTAAKLTIGTDGQVLAADSSQTTGTKWVTPAGSSTQQSTLYNLGLSATVGANALTVKITQSDGTSDPTAGSPVTIALRSSTATTGGYNARSITSSISLVVPTSATLGMVDGIANYLWVYALDNAGTVEVAISGTKYDENTVKTTTTISSSATSNSVIYSTTGRSNVPLRLIGRIKISETSAGTWATGPTEVGLFSIDPAGTVTVTAAYTMSNVDRLVLASGAALTVTLPAAATAGGRTIAIKKTDSSLANIITVARAGSDTIDGATSTTLNTQYESLTLVSDGSASWAVKDRYIKQNTNSSLTFTPTNFGTISGPGFYSRRVGDSLYVTGNFTMGTPSGTLSLALPVTIDNTKIATSASGAQLGEFVATTGSNNGLYGSSNDTGKVFFDGTDTANVYFALNVSNTNTLVKSASGSYGASTAVSMSFVIPVSGWSA